ncbi:hypothetical protein IQ244_29540 [Nostoc sp. LEGE 06077]|uniref:hypothetical protein n=1 Tax=Nostoc sp. LEGE 06077 TaxID=915325 RepID=UPI00187E85C1|nr:hypothetical protein [Nostoc sp. LEGE 06077]MBE9210573.1 hypothetical protein [Nostoc sp. LEGE 06077]
MIRERKPRGVRPTARGYELLQNARANKLDSNSKRFTYKRIAEEATVDVKTVQRFFKNQAVDIASATAIISVFDLKIFDIIPPHESIIENSIQDSEESKQIFLDQIKAKEEEIRLLQEKGTLYELDIKRLEDEKLELEICVQRLDESLKIFKGITIEFEERIKASREGATWLNDRRQKALAREAVEYLLLEYPEIKQYGEDLNSSSQLQQFVKDIRKYLYLIHHCLYMGSYNLLHKAMIESRIPFTLQPSAYITAFQFIKNQRISSEMPSIVVKELKFYLDYLIKLIEPLC